MSERTQRLLAEILGLPADERRELTRRLIEQHAADLPELPDTGEPEEEAEARWLAEVGQRSDEVAAGTAELIPHAEVMEAIRRRLAARRAERAE